MALQPYKYKITYQMQEQHRIYNLISIADSLNDIFKFKGFLKWFALQYARTTTDHLQKRCTSMLLGFLYSIPVLYRLYIEQFTLGTLP